MGLILDSSILIAGERRGETLRQILRRVGHARRSRASALSVVTIVELTHGIYRARNDTDRERRRVL
jgi:predicted nucleic acid-binding protein